MKIGDYIRIVGESTEFTRVMAGPVQVWPNSYYATLAPSWTYAGQYTLAAIPASGGSATPTWVFKVFRTGETTTPVYQANVSPTVVCEELFGESWLTAQHFHYTGGVWSADDRARNGLNDSSGTSAPQSAPARYSRLSASYSYTFNGVRVSASAQVQMTQNPNNVRSISASYSNPRVILSRYNTSASPAPAYQTTDATVSAFLDAETLYQFYDGVTNVDGLDYTYIQEDAVTSERFNFSCAWCDFLNQSSSGATVRVESRGTDYDTYGRSTSIRATFTGDPTKYAEVDIYQAENVFINSQKDFSEAWAETFALDGTIPATATSFTIYGTFHFKSRQQYSSLAWSAWDWDYDDATVNITSVSPSSGVSVSGNVVHIQENTGHEDIEYETTSTVTYDGQTKTGITASVTQEGVAQVITFANPVITDFYYPETDGYNIPASGGAVNPVVVFEIEYSINGVHDNSMVLSGSVDEGENHGTLDDGVATCDYDIYYRVGGQSSSDGEVSANSRGTNPDPDGTTTIQLATNCYAYVRIDGKNSSNSSSETVTQQANHEESTEEFGQTYSLVDLDFVWNSHNAKALSAGETGYLTWAECKEYYYIRTWYTSGGHIDGQTQYDRDIDADASESASWLTTSGYYVTAERNTKSGGERSATVYAVYGGNTLGSVTVTQAETISWYSLESSYSSGLTFTAAGGSQTVTFKGYHNYDNGDSPTETSSPGVTVTYDGDVSGRISNGGTQGRTITASNLGSDPYDEVDTHYTYQWTLHSEATCDIPVTQGPNEPGNFGTVSFPAPGSTAGPGGDSINLNPTCPFTWTSGSSGTMMGDGFDFEYVVMANDTYRTYGFTGHYADFGSLGTNTRSFGNTTIRAILKADSSKTATAIIQEEANGPTNNHQLLISWSNPVIIPGYGGSINVGIVTAKYKTQYDSGDWDNGESITPAQVAASIQISGSGFTKSYTSGNSYVTISAPYNPDSTSARDCDVTAYYGGESDTTTVTQKKCPFDVDYVESTEGGQRIRTAYIYNTDDERHRYGYTKETSVAGVVDTTTGTAGPISAGGNQNMGAVPLVSGYTNTIAVDIDTVEDYSGGSWVSHTVIKS